MMGRYSDDSERQKLENNCNPDGSCSKCCRCCNVLALPLSESETEQMAKYAAEHEFAPAEGAGTEGITYCPFLNVGHCAVYEVRPKICQTYFCNLEDAKLIAMRNKRTVETEGDTELWKTFYPEDE